MTIAATTLANAADRFIETALMGDDWRDPLAQLAAAAGAHGATLVRYNPLDKHNSNLHDQFILATSSIADPVLEYLSGSAPPDPRLTRVSPKADQGFLADFDQFSSDEIERDPFYEEFLRPRKLRWHACARVDDSPDHGQLFLSLKRHVSREHYDPTEIRALNRSLPKIHMAASISRTVLQAENRGARGVLGQRGEVLLEFDTYGRLISFNEPASLMLDPAFGLRNGRLLAPLPEDQARLDRALGAPLGDPPQVACIALRTRDASRRFVFRVMPVVGAARDVFSAAAALATVTEWEKPNIPPDILVKVLREAFDLTGAEARIAALVGLGVTLAESARILAIGEGTARNYIKAAQAKIGTSRQAELASLITLMRG